MTRRTADTIFAGILLALCCVLYAETLSEAYQHTGQATMNNAVFYPRILLAALFGLALLMLGQAWRGGATGNGIEIRQKLGPVTGVVIVTIVYALVFMAVPFALAGAVYCAAVALILGYRRILIVATAAIAIPMAIWLIFETMLGVSLP